MPTISRTTVRARRSDGREFPSVAFAFRQLLGTREELGSSEHHRIRAALRRGQTSRDSHGFTWSAVGEVQRFSSVAEAVASATRGAIAWSDLTFGVELEVISPVDHDTLRAKLAAAGFNGWRVMSDGSLNGGGAEVVSPVLKGEEGIAALNSVTRLLKSLGCTADLSCGMHVHVGARDFSSNALRNVAFSFLGAEQHFDSIVPPSRRANRYARSNVSTVRGNTGDLLSARSASTMARVMNGGWSTQHYNNYRYHKLNFQSFALHGTIEFRQHAGTVEADKACAWVRLVTGFVAAAASQSALSAIPTVSFEQFLSFTDEAGQRFVNARRARFAVRAAA